MKITAGSFHACGIRTDDTVECWGRDDDGQATPPW
ncbi:MAG: RCC1-like domain-containing protein [Bradymonadaceae bacterium]